LADLLAFYRASNHADEIDRSGRQYGEAQTRLAATSGFFNGTSVLITNLSLWLVVYLTIPLVIDGRIDGPMLAALALLTLASFEAVTPLSQAAQLWESLRQAASRLFEIVDSHPPVTDIGARSEARSRSALESGRDLSVEFSNLSFRYPSQENAAVEAISFKVEAGKSLAIIGTSGAGKSTLINLLLRFWDYDSGDIHLGHTSLLDLEPERAQGLFSVVSQRSHFFNTSIYENLRLARPAATMDEIVTAARQAQVHDFIIGLPHGYDTIIGEQGNRLSAGERQRLAIARALLRDAPLLILDEPTANLDPLTEKQVMETLHRIMMGRTSLLITHRLVGLEAMDEILVLEAGRIVERGSQSELLHKDGWFRRLWNLQNRILNVEATDDSQR
jgi:ATP-binding cassette subfamily C protein CydC